MLSYAELSALELNNTRFLPDNVTSLTLFLNNSPSVTDGLRNTSINNRISFAGQYSTHVSYSKQEGVKLINVDFNAWGAYTLFGVPQQLLKDKTFDAVTVFPSLKKYICHLEDHLHDPKTCIDLLQQFLLEQLQIKKTQNRNKQIIYACKELVKSNGNFAIKKLCREVGMSQNSFANYFSEIVGVTPKLFSRITRFNAVQNFLVTNPLSGWQEIVAEFDYFDQNHFIREFKQFAGITPKKTKQWEALFEPLKKAIDEGFANDPVQMQEYRINSLTQILFHEDIKEE